MKIRRTVGLMCAALLMSASAGVHTQSGAPYTIMELGTLGGVASEAFDINASGQVVGYAWTTGNAAYHPVLWQDGTTIDLGTLGGLSGGARAINDSGQVVGAALWSGGGPQAFLWQNGTMTALGPIAGGSSAASAINAWGNVAGWGNATPEGAAIHAFRYQNGGVSDLGTLGGNLSQAFGINDSGQIVGWANVTPTGGTNADDASSVGPPHAFLWQDGVMKDLGTLGGNQSFAYAVNASGHVVGVARTADNRNHPFRWHNDVMTDLGVPDGMHAWAMDINVSGDVVGMASVWDEAGGFGGETPLLWQNGVMTDLNSLLPPGSDWVLEVAAAINDCGQIVGTGRFNGLSRAFLLTPPDASNRCITPANPSPDGTKVPPANHLVDATGAVWTLSAGGQTLRNGIHAGSGYGLSLLWTGGTLYTYASDNQWWQWTGSQWIVYGATRPDGTGGTPVSPDGTELPPAGHVIDAMGAVWTLGAVGETLRNGIHAASGYGLSLLWTGGTLYTYASDNQWWQWTGSQWIVYGSTRPGGTGGTPVSPDGTELPPAGHVIDATGAVWTLGPGGQTLRNGIHAASGYGLSLLWTGGTLYTYASDDQWWQWTGSGWLVYGAARPGDG